MTRDVPMPPGIAMPDPGDGNRPGYAPRRRTRRKDGRGRGLALERLEGRWLLSTNPGDGHLPSAQVVAPSNDPRIDAVLGGSRWGIANITYSFYDGGGYYGSEANPTPVSTAVRDNVRTILANVISPLVNLTFTEVPDSASSYGLIRYLCSSTPTYAYAYEPTGGNVNGGGSGDIAGDVVLNTSYDAAGTGTNLFRLGAGSHGFQTLIHETCHALGLKHPGDYNGDGTGDPPFLPAGQDNGDNTLMSYNFSSGREPASPMAYDVLALQYLYGAKSGTRSGDTTYAFTKADVYSASDGGSVGSGSRSSKNTLWDGGGSDTVDLSGLPAVTGGYRVDIASGGWITPASSYNTVGYAASAGSPTTFSSGTQYVATDFGTRIALAGTTIENVVASRSTDAIYLNDAGNRVSGYAPGTATGDDVIYASNQYDTLDLSRFTEASVVSSQSGTDLRLNLGTAGTVTVKNYYAVPASVRMGIVYAPPPPTISIAVVAADKQEGDTGTTPFSFTITRSGDTKGTSSVAWAADGSNRANAADFAGGVLPSGTVTFAAGETAKTVVVAVAGDKFAEADEEFTVTLSAPTGAVLGAAAAAIGRIRNDDAYPRVSIAAADAIKAEGNSGSVAFTFDVTRTGNLADASSVAWAVAGYGPAPANAADFVGVTLPAGTVSFAAGETVKRITVAVRGDVDPEQTESFTVSLSQPFGTTIGTATATGTIRNDDYKSTLSIAATSAALPEGNIGRTVFTFFVSRSGATSGEVSVRWAVSGSGAKPADARDFIGGSLPSGLVRFAPGSVRQSVTVNVLGDLIGEFDEEFTVTLLDLTITGEGIGVDVASAKGTILNDDPIRPSAGQAAFAMLGRAAESLAPQASLIVEGQTTANKRASFGSG